MHHEFNHAHGACASKAANCFFWYFVLPLHGHWEFSHNSTAGHIMVHHKFHDERDYYSSLHRRRDSVINYYVFGILKW